MAKVAVDFGTGNTVITRIDEPLSRVETIEIPGISRALRYRLRRDKPERTVHVIPSMIYYSKEETLIGAQVTSRGLSDDRNTFRWMKRSIAQRSTKRKKTEQGFKNSLEAGSDFLRIVLSYASDQVSVTDDEFTFTAPTEAFECFEEWLRDTCEQIGIRRLRLLDEPTACVLGYEGSARKDDRYVVFDFGCGTLDVCVVRIDLAAPGDNKATQLGRAGRELGGLDVDQWIARDFAERHRLDDTDRKLREATLLRLAEQAKIGLSNTATAAVEMVFQADPKRPEVLCRTVYRRSCEDCERGRSGRQSENAEGCLGCLLLTHGFLKTSRETLDRALENAAVKAGVRRDEIVRVLVTGGSSLIPAVRRMLVESFGERAVLNRPFDAVARGACRGIVLPILQHDYAIESYNRQRRKYEFAPLFPAGAEYPTPPDAVRLWARGTYDGMTRIGLKIFEVSGMGSSNDEVMNVDQDGVLRSESLVETDHVYACLNEQNPTFIDADPPVILGRDQERFLCSFWVDGQRRLLVSVVDHLRGEKLLENHPVVRL